MVKIFKYALAVFACLAIAVGCSTVGTDVSDDMIDVNDISQMSFGAKKTYPIITNRYDGLTTYWRQKGKVYNNEQIVVSKTNIGGFSVTEADAAYDEFKDSPEYTNTWAVATISNNNTKVEINGNFEDYECYKDRDGDAMLTVFTGKPEDMSEQEWSTMTNMGVQCICIYRTTTFDAILTNRYDRVLSVDKDSITDMTTAINAFNALLNGLKAQQE